MDDGYNNGTTAITQRLLLIRGERAFCAHNNIRYDKFCGPSNCIAAAAAAVLVGNEIACAGSRDERQKPNPYTRVRVDCYDDCTFCLVYGFVRTKANIAGNKQREGNRFDRRRPVWETIENRVMDVSRETQPVM